ncbi:MAG: zinc-binding dehydrogenase, partial [Gemmatimonadota bacterium]
MRAARLKAPGRWELLEVDGPGAPGPGQMRVRLERTAICGTDKSHYRGLMPSYPIAVGAPGHEGMGVVEACPSGKFREGDRVLLWGFDRGLYQECCLAPDVGPVPLPRDVEPEVALMSQLLGTVIHCFYKLGNVINQDVVVLGQGPVGQLFNACLRNLGARRIIAVDPLAYRLEVGRQMGATHAVDSSAADVKAAVAEITGGAMADAAVEAVGMTASFNLAGELLRRGGDLIYFGVPNKENLGGVMELQFGRMFGNETRIVTSVGPNPQ